MNQSIFVQGLAYVDFSDDAHLSAALEKNRQLLLGKRVSIARSNPKQSKKRGSAGHGTSTEHEGKFAGHDSKASVHISEGTRGDDNVQLKGKNTFAVPRNVRPLGWTSKDKSTLKPKPEGAVEGGDEAPKSNDEFRKMLIKS
ncbi:hypothetical protein RJ639_014339 [Escallonia herrerae]|uniref:LSM-interacting domain-containing protein n=1 Tax=Escallonia herrerae TaxID=1293975 RepID=A0AA88VGI2_9ASTE|nr:hypothetical protein RJ639_014339 [Escallonia herrerae]